MWGNAAVTLLCGVCVRVVWELLPLTSHPNTTDHNIVDASTPPPILVSIADRPMNHPI